MQYELDGLVKKIDRYLDIFEITVVMLAFGGMTIVVMISVILRYVLKVPNMAGEEIARYLLVTVTFIGLSMCMRTKSHMGVTVFVDRLPPLMRHIVKCIADAITTITIISISVFSWKYTLAGVGRPQISVATGLPMYIMYGVMAIGFSLSSIRLIMLFWNEYISKTHPLNSQEGGNAQ